MMVKVKFEPHVIMTLDDAITYNSGDSSWSIRHQGSFRRSLVMRMIIIMHLCTKETILYLKNDFTYLSNTVCQ